MSNLVTLRWLYSTYTLEFGDTLYLMIYIPSGIFSCFDPQFSFCRASVHAVKHMSKSLSTFIKTGTEYPGKVINNSSQSTAKSFEYWLVSFIQSKLQLDKNINVQGTPLSNGIVGISYDGGYSYTNMIIQCLSHTTNLRTYFTSSKYKLDINKSNPNGHNGKLAYEFCKLLDNI